MQLAHIDFDKLSLSPINMRHGRRAPDIADILPSIRARGILVPLLVRAGDDPEYFEIVAGRRRYFSAKTVNEEGGDITSLPCAIMEPGDDAAALEASLLENIARLDPDPMQQYEALVDLVRKGRGVAEIATTFGLTEALVKQRLALGNLLPKIREAYGKLEIDNETVRALTLATKKQQKEWLTLYSEEKQQAPRGAQLKRWLFGGRPISTTAALFPLADYSGEIVADLFGDSGYFADGDLFWQLQNAAITAKCDAYRAAGWKVVEIMPTGDYFHSWEHERTPKRQGGKVFISITSQGDVSCHEGYLKRAEAAKRRAGSEKAQDGSSAKVTRPEVTAPLQAYINLHRHAAVCDVLADHAAIALRLLLARLIAGSGPWQRRFETPATRHEGTVASLSSSTAARRLEARRTEILALLGSPEDQLTILGQRGDEYEVAAVFQRLLDLAESEIMRIVAMVMADALGSATPLVEMLGCCLKIDMGGYWQADEAFFELVRDREVVNAMLAEVAGSDTAGMHVGDTTKRQKEIIGAYLTGANGRPKVDKWLPRWMQFPAKHYTERGGLNAGKAQSRFSEMASQAAAESDINGPAKA